MTIGERLEISLALNQQLARNGEGVDARRRYGKVARLDHALDLADANDWTIVDMATDWNTVFPVDAGS